MIAADTEEEFDYHPASYEESQEESQFSQARKKKRRIKKKKSSPYEQGHWSLDEHDLYLSFLRINYERCMQEKHNTIFKQMASYIGTRSAAQCRSHHQKFNPLVAQQRKHRTKKPKTKTVSDETTIDQMHMDSPLLLFIHHDEPKLIMYSDDDDMLYQEEQRFPCYFE